MRKRLGGVAAAYVKNVWMPRREHFWHAKGQRGLGISQGLSQDSVNSWA